MSDATLAALRAGFVASQHLGELLTAPCVALPVGMQAQYMLGVVGVLCVVVMVLVELWLDVGCIGVAGAEDELKRTVYRRTTIGTKRWSIIGSVL